MHLIDSANAMERLAGGADALLEKFAWLPTWHDATAWLDDRGVPRQALVAALQDAVDNDRSDLEAIYGLILETLEQPADRSA